MLKRTCQPRQRSSADACASCEPTLAGRKSSSPKQPRSPRPTRAIWNAFWSGGISNPLEVIEQITYLLFIRRLDDLQKNAESKAATLGTPVERVVFPAGNDPKGRPYEELRWSRFRHREAKEMYEI